LVLSTGLIESMHMPTYGRQGQLLKATEKIPYRVGIIGYEYFYFPGVYNDWFDIEAGQWLRTVAFGATGANGLMQQIHNSKNGCRPY
jgi:putative SOS response-associated peptidase YedK